MVAAAYINSLGLCRLAHKLWMWVSPRLLFLKAVQVPGGRLLVQRRPKPGRMEAPPGGVGRDLVLFWDSSCRCLPHSTHCSLFFSLGRDNPPLGTDTMSHQWPQGLLYVFPPFGFLRIRIEEVWLLLIAPNWPHIVWFSDPVDHRSDPAGMHTFLIQLLSKTDSFHSSIVGVKA